MADQEDAANIIVPTQESAASHSPTCVKLSAADYTLGALGFGKPKLNTVAPLKIESYSLGPLEFNVPAPRYGHYEQRIVWHDAPLGRHPRISDDAKQRMIAATKVWLTERQITNIRRISMKDRGALKKFVRELAKNEGVVAKDSTLHKHVIKAALPARAST